MSIKQLESQIEKSYILQRGEQIVQQQLNSPEVIKKYDKAGCYCIKIQNRIVYVGKSKNMLVRLGQHLACIERPQKNMYEVLQQAKKEGLKIGFDVLYYSKSQTEEQMFQEIGEEEGRLIRELRPILNYQIPKEENYKSYTVNKLAKTADLALVKYILNI